MKLILKFNLIFVLVFGAGLALEYYLAHDLLQRNAQREIQDRARLMMQTTLATRDYTVQEISPLLINRERNSVLFIPQTVPAFAATEIFQNVQRHNPDYSYKEATLNPTNLRDRAADWEADIVNRFRSHQADKELFGERDTPTGKSLYFARPITIQNGACLECHDTAARAPKAVVTQYGANNGFGWKLGETIGAQIVSVPETLVIETADRALAELLIGLGIMSLVVLALLDAMLIVLVIRPVAHLSQLADDVSRGKIEVEDFPVRGKDEIAQLGGSFNRMLRSLRRALKLLSIDIQP